MNAKVSEVELIKLELPVVNLVVRLSDADLEADVERVEGGGLAGEHIDAVDGDGCD